MIDGLLLRVDDSKLSYTAWLSRGRFVVCKAVGFFHHGKIAVFQINTTRGYERRGYATRLLRELSIYYGGRAVYPFNVTQSTEAIGFWKAWLMAQDRVDQRGAIQLFLARSPITELSAQPLEA
jgi:hypothetical protein